MVTRTNHQPLIEWLDTTAKWLAHRADLVGHTRSTMTKSIDRMVFRAPAGERVRHSVSLMAKSFESIQRELDFMSRVCQREAGRYHQVDHALTQIYGRAEATNMIGSVEAVNELKRFELDPEAWADHHVAPEPVEEHPVVEPVDPDEPTTVEVGTLEWTHGPIQPRCLIRPTPFPIRPWPTNPDPGFGRPLPDKRPGRRYEMDLRSMRVAAVDLLKVSQACQDHQAAITRHLGTLPPKLSKRLRRRFERTRRSCSLSLERSARRLSRQAALLRTRASTPGLVDGIFHAGLTPVFVEVSDRMAHLPAVALIPGNLTQWTDHVVSVAEHVDHAMSRLVRHLPVVYGSLPAGWWKPHGYTDAEPPHAIWGDNIPPHLLAVLPLLQGTRPAPLLPPPHDDEPDDESNDDESSDDESSDDGDGQTGDDGDGDGAGGGSGNGSGSGAGNNSSTSGGSSNSASGGSSGSYAGSTSSHGTGSLGYTRGAGGFHGGVAGAPILEGTDPDTKATDDTSTPKSHGSLVNAPTAAAGGVAVGAGTAGGAVLMNKKARSKITDWAGYVKKKGILAKKGSTP